jgi:hypothetical protein
VIDRGGMDASAAKIHPTHDCPRSATPLADIYLHPPPSRPARCRLPPFAASTLNEIESVLAELSLINSDRLEWIDTINTHRQHSSRSALARDGGGLAWSLILLRAIFWLVLAGGSPSRRGGGGLAMITPCALCVIFILFV